MDVSAEDFAFHSNIPVPLDITVAVVYSVFGVCSLFGNSTLLYISYKKKRLLKPAEFFIVNLAVSDLGLTLSLYPMAITSSFYHRWLYGQTVCSVYAFCGILFGVCSLTTLTLLSVVCFVKVCYPLYGNRFRSVHGRLLVSCAWLYALLFACSPLVHWGEYGPEPYGTACCIDWRLSNQRSTARSYTVALFVFCFILPCCVIVASYTGILATVHASRKTMEHHTTRQTHMSSIQTIIVKLSVAVCIGFFTAWSPYAVVSMWAAFGHVESIPPVAFAMPAMFAKSSTIYNPIIYLTMRPNFRRVMFRDLRRLCGGCLRSCFCSRCSTPKIRVRLRRRSARKQRKQIGSSNSSPRPPVVTPKDHRCEECKDERFRRCPQTCHRDSAGSHGDSGGPRTHQREVGCVRPSRKSLRATMCVKREIDNLHISLEMVPGHAKVAWP